MVRALPWLALAVACRGDDDPCALGAPVSSVDDALALVEELPQPVTLACFVSALERPLGVVLTSDVFNTQPAEGVRSPRILIRGDDLSMTLVPVGEARTLLEFGEAWDGPFTVKAELEFPIDGPVEPAAPYDRILAGPGLPGTGCQVCHFTEVETGDGRFANVELRPPTELVVPLEVLRSERERCPSGDDPERCAILAAVLDHGDVFERPYPTEVATQFGPVP